MSIRQRPCRACGAAIVLARTPTGGWAPLEPWPDPASTVRVDVLATGLVLLGDAPASARTRRYARHDCVPAGKAAPRVRPEQLMIGGAG